MVKRQFLVTAFGSNIDVFVAPRQILKFLSFEAKKPWIFTMPQLPKRGKESSDRRKSKILLQ